MTAVHWKAIFAAEPLAVLVAAAIALVGVLFSALVSALVARRGTYIATVTAERSKWIDNLRRNISQALGTASYLHSMIVEEGIEAIEEEDNELLRNTAVLLATVRLQLNPLGEIDANIILLLRAMPAWVRNDDDAYDNFETLLIRHSQWLLKEEWEKVKYESRGMSRFLTEPFKRYKRLRAYRQFCQNEGALPAWIRDAAA